MSNFVKAEIFFEKISPAANISAGNRRENDRDKYEKNKTKHTFRFYPHFAVKHC